MFPQLLSRSAHPRTATTELGWKAGFAALLGREGGSAAKLGEEQPSFPAREQNAIADAGETTARVSLLTHALTRSGKQKELSFSSVPKTHTAVTADKSGLKPISTSRNKPAAGQEQPRCGTAEAAAGESAVQNLEIPAAAVTEGVVKSIGQAQFFPAPTTIDVKRAAEVSNTTVVKESAPAPQSGGATSCSQVRPAVRVSAQKVPVKTAPHEAIATPAAVRKEGVQKEAGVPSEGFAPDADETTLELEGDKPASAEVPGAEALPDGMKPAITLDLTSAPVAPQNGVAAAQTGGIPPKGMASKRKAPESSNTAADALPSVAGSTDAIPSKAVLKTEATVGAGGGAVAAQGAVGHAATPAVPPAATAATPRNPAGGAPTTATNETPWTASTEMKFRPTEGANVAEWHVNLRTEELGRVEIHTAVRDSHVTASVAVEDGAARTAVAAELNGLQGRLVTHELQLERLSVSVGAEARHAGTDTGGGSRQAYQESAQTALPNEISIPSAGEDEENTSEANINVRV